jgi:hypothetical protein
MYELQMKKTFLVAELALALAVAAGSSRAADDFTWSGPIAEGLAIEIKGVNGDIRAEAGSGPEVQVTATKTARRSDPESVKVEVVEHAGGVTVCAVYPPSDGRTNECAPGKGGRMNTRDNDVKVEFTVRVPAGVRLVGRTVNGGITAAGLKGDIEAHSVNGGVEVETAGRAEADTVNGGITVRTGRADWTGPARFETVNGSISVTLPADANADISARTVNGSVDTDFFVSPERGSFKRRKLSGRIGDGGRTLELETVNGSIELRKK